VEETCTRKIVYNKPCQTVKFLVQVDLYKFLNCVSPPLVGNACLVCPRGDRRRCHSPLLTQSVAAQLVFPEGPGAKLQPQTHSKIRNNRIRWWRFWLHLCNISRFWLMRREAGWGFDQTYNYICCGTRQKQHTIDSKQTNSDHSSQTCTKKRNSAATWQTEPSLSLCHIS